MRGELILGWGVTLFASLLAAMPTGAPVGNTPFVRYEAEDGQLVFYLSRHPPEQQLPLILFIQGTGCGSAFIEEDGRIISGLQSVLLEASHGSAVVMTVEKPGVRFLDSVPNPGDSRKCRPEFIRGYSLDSWCSTLVRALRVAHGFLGIDRSRTLVIAVKLKG